MPYILSPKITATLPELWREGAPYSKQIIYDIHSGSTTLPPVHYESHTLKPHSLCHIDAPGHTIPNGKTITDFFFDSELRKSFFGSCTVVSIINPAWTTITTPTGATAYEYRISEKQLRILCPNPKARVIISCDPLPLNKDGSYDHNYALVLSKEAAEFLISKNIKLYGTPYKSTDFEPNSRGRPIHKIFFDANALVMECLDMRSVPNGEYYLSAFPLPLDGATEAPVCPVLFEYDELT